MNLINVSVVILPILLAGEVYSATVSLSKPTATVFSPTTTSLFTNIPTTFLKTTRRQLGPVFPNPIVFQIPASATANVTCKAEAAFVQLAIFTFPGANIVSFQGNGPNVPMTRVGSGSTAFINKPQPTAYQVQALFQFSQAQFPPFNFEDSEVREVNSSSSLISIGSEDSVDDDNNDTIARIEITPGPVSQCDTGTLQCCNSLQPASSSSVSTLLGLLGINPSTVTGEVGVTCSPISVIGVGGNSCSAQPACCTNNSFNGVVALGCTPVNLNL